MGSLDYRITTALVLLVFREASRAKRDFSFSREADVLSQSFFLLVPGSKTYHTLFLFGSRVSVPNHGVLHKFLLVRLENESRTTCQHRSKRERRRVATVPSRNEHRVLREKELILHRRPGDKGVTGQVHIRRQKAKSVRTRTRSNHLASTRLQRERSEPIFVDDM